MGDAQSAMNPTRREARLKAVHRSRFREPERPFSQVVNPAC